MKKFILILFVLLTTTTSAFPASILDEFIKNHLTNHILEEDIPDDDTADEYFEPEKLIKKEPIKVEPVKVEAVKVESVLPKDTMLEMVAQINSLDTDEQKVKKWAKYSSKENYVIIDKKDCSAIVYDKDGHEIKSFEIGIGREIGDDYNDTRGLYGKAKNTTPAGEYTLIKNIINQAAYGDFTLSLGEKANKKQASKKVVAMHKVPKFRAQERLKKFDDGNLSNNRMSHGCINFLEKDFNEFTKYIKSGFKVFVLPEEKDNQLMLEKNDKGQYELVQTKY